MRFDPATHTVHAGGRTWQADPARTLIEDEWYGERPGWSVGPTYGRRRRRCLVRFESGWSASIIWGSGTYSTNHDAWRRGVPFTEEPTTVEVGVIDYTGELFGDPGRLDDDELVALLDHLAVRATEQERAAADAEEREP